MKEDSVGSGRVDVFKMFPNLRIAVAPIAAMKIRIIACLLLLCGLNGWLAGQFRHLPDFRESAMEGFLPGSVVSGMSMTVGDATVVLNLASRWLEHLLRLSCHVLSLAVMCTAVSSFSAKRIFRNESCSMIKCLHHSLKSWRSLLQAVAIGGCLVVLCRISLWLMLALANFVGASAVAAPVGVLAFTLLGGVSILAVGLGCVAVGYDECSGAEGVSRGLSYALSRPGLTVLMLVSIAALTRLTRLLVLTLLQSFRNDFATQSAPWNATFLFDSIHMAIWLSGFAIMYVRLRNEVDGVPEAEFSR